MYLMYIGSQIGTKHCRQHTPPHVFSLFVEFTNLPAFLFLELPKLERPI